MDGRYPFQLQQAAQLQQQQMQLNQQAAQLRAALGIPQGIEISEAHAFLQAQAHERQRQAHERDLQIRQLLLQEQIEQHLTEQRLLSLREQQLIREAQLAAQRQASTTQYPNLNDEYRNILLQEQLLQQRRVNGAQPSALVQNLPRVGALDSLSLQSQSRHQARVQDALRQQHATELARPATTAGHTGHFGTTDHSSVRSEGASAPKMVVDMARLPQNYYHRSPERKLTSPSADLEMETKKKKKIKHLLPDDKVDGKVLLPERLVSPHTVASPELDGLLPSDDPQKLPTLVGKNRKPKVPGRKPGRPKKEQAENGDKPPKRKYTRKKQMVGLHRAIEASEIVTNKEADALGGLLSVATGGLKDRNELRKGTFEDIVAAAEDELEIDGAAEALCNFRGVNDECVISEVEQFNDNAFASLKLENRPAFTIEAPTFRSEIPSLPKEPGIFLTESKPLHQLAWFDASGNDALNAEGDDHAHKMNAPLQKKKRKKTSTDAKNPDRVDKWWPSNSTIQKEKSATEASDNESDEEGRRGVMTSQLRSVDTKICARLADSVEPGLLEKLPHCKIHRLRTLGKEGGTEEFHHCFQVTDLYPNELMVNCSRCGTWRHAVCGGHHTSFSTRRNAETPFVCICDRCHEEAKYLKRFRKGAQRLQRQRMQHLRRALAASAVMRFAISDEQTKTKRTVNNAESLNGKHARSAQARHETAEKVWAAMVANLTDSSKLSTKLQKQNRAKEFEKLLTWVEDAENSTLRHNMLLFLLRDTARDVPVGFEKQMKNFFDPEEWGDQETDVVMLDRDESSVGISDSQPGLSCARVGCHRKPRFDSVFCSDACGVNVMEEDLIMSIREADALQPALLRPSKGND